VAGILPINNKQIRTKNNEIRTDKKNNEKLSWRPAHAFGGRKMRGAGAAP
jgi:hypothetical protein